MSEETELLRQIVANQEIAKQKNNELSFMRKAMLPPILVILYSAAVWIVYWIWRGLNG